MEALTEEVAAKAMGVTGLAVGGPGIPVPGLPSPPVGKLQSRLQAAPAHNARPTAHKVRPPRLYGLLSY